MMINWKIEIKSAIAIQRWNGKY